MVVRVPRGTFRGQPAHELRRRRRRSGARVEQGDLDFALRECAVHGGQVPDHGAEEAEARAGLEHREQPPGARGGRDVAETRA